MNVELSAMSVESIGMSVESNEMWSPWSIMTGRAVRGGVEALRSINVM